jgi:hypothetical protein
VIEEFQLSLTVCETSAQDLKRWVRPFPDVVLVNLAASKPCLDLLSDMQQWPDARIIFVSAFDDIHLIQIMQKPFSLGPTIPAKVAGDR